MSNDKSKPSARPNTPIPPNQQGGTSTTANTRVDLGNGQANNGGVTGDNSAMVNGRDDGQAQNGSQNNPAPPSANADDHWELSNDPRFDAFHDAFSGPASR